MVSFGLRLGLMLTEGADFQVAEHDMDLIVTAVEDSMRSRMEFYPWR